MENHAWRAEAGWTCSGGTPTSSETCTEIWGDEADAAVKDCAAIVVYNFVSDLRENLAILFCV